MNFFSVQSSAVGINQPAHPPGPVECCWKLSSSVCFVLPSDVSYLSCNIVGHPRTKVIAYVSSYLLPDQHNALHIVGILLKYGLPGVLFPFGIALLAPLGMGGAGACRAWWVVGITMGAPSRLKHLFSGQKPSTALFPLAMGNKNISDNGRPVPRSLRVISEQSPLTKPQWYIT